MRIVTADPVRRRRPRIDDGAVALAARVERFALVVTTAVVTFGLWSTYAGHTSGFGAIRSDLTSGRIVNLAALRSSAGLLPALKLFREDAERSAIAEAIYRTAAASHNGPLTHVGGLAGVTLPAEQVRADKRLLVLNERLSNRPGYDVPVLSAADIAALKPAVVVRMPEEYRRRMLIAGAVFMLAFWLAHAVRWLMGATGDPLLLPIVHLLTGLGLMVMIAIRDPLRDTLAAATVANGIAAGCLAWIAISLVDFENPRLRRAVIVPLGLAVGLALALLVLGGGPAGSGVKVNLFGVQPVEIIRPLFVFSLAAYFARRWQFLRELSQGAGASGTLRRHVRRPRWKDVRPLAISIGTLLTFFFLQKDLGPALVLSCVFLGLYGIARARGTLVTCGFAALAAGLGAGYALGFPATVTRRVAIWLDPWENALPGGDQIAHALWALSTGGFHGLGLGVGDPQLIPAGHTDLVIAAIGEELGFVGVCAVVALFALLVWRMLRVALRAPGDYTAFLTVGLTLALAVQGLVIVSGVLGLLPLTGVVMPFLSFGRSSMLSNMAAVAVCSAVARRCGPVREAFAAPVRILAWTLALVGAVVVVRSAVVQVVRADAIATRANLTLQADGVYRYQYNPRLIAAARQIVRGTIYDRNGLPVATSRADELTALADRYRRLGIVLPAACREARARCYPLGGTAFHVLGDADRQTNWAARNTSFAEKDFDARLKGFDDQPQPVAIRNRQNDRVYTVIKRNYEEILPLARHKRNLGHPDALRLLSRNRDVRLTLDAGLQMGTSRALRERARMNNSSAGAAVVLDAASGDLLAAASYPWPEDDDMSLEVASGHVDPQWLLDRARYGLYPPGSTFKLVTAVAALRADPSLSDATFECVRLREDRVGGFVHGAAIRDDPLDRVPHGRLNLRHALVKSCNLYFAQLADQIGAKALGEAAAAAQISVARQPLADNLPRNLSHAGYGQGDVVASPMRMAGVVAALASDGVLKDLRVATEPSRSQAPGVRWVDADSAAELRGYMREVVTAGTGSALATHHIAIAGKTGTAQVNDARSHSWFVGFAPYAARGRKIAFAVVIENGGYGAQVAAPLAGDIVTTANKLGLLQ